MAIIDPLEVHKADEVIQALKTANFELSQVLSAKKTQLKTVLDLLEEFKVIDSSMNEYKKELYRLFNEDIYKQKLKYAQAYIGLLDPIVSGMQATIDAANAKKAAAADKGK